jgi:hypothetical protein
MNKLFLLNEFDIEKIPNWYHFSCFFKKATPPDTSSIKGFDGLRWDDQQKIKNKLGMGDSKVAGESSGEATADNFSIDYSKSSRSKCKKCDLKIDIVGFHSIRKFILTSYYIHNY